MLSPRNEDYLLRVRWSRHLAAAARSEASPSPFSAASDTAARLPDARECPLSSSTCSLRMFTQVLWTPCTRPASILRRLSLCCCRPCAYGNIATLFGACCNNGRVANEKEDLLPKDQLFLLIGLPCLTSLSYLLDFY